MPSKYGFGNSRKKSPYKMGKPAYAMDQKNPVKMDHAMKFNAELKQASADGKLSGKFKEAVDASPAKMYGSKPMKHSEDSAGIKHGNAGHLKPADDVSNRGKAATDYYSKKGSATKKHGKALKHKKDSAGIKHGNAGHLKPADDVSTRGQAATDYYKNNPGAATKMYSRKKK
jgi:hypothetical protein